MQANVGGADRIARIIVGLLIMAEGYYLQTWYGLIGLPVMLTGLFRFCSIYCLFGASTNKLAKAESGDSQN